MLAYIPYMDPMGIEIMASEIMVLKSTSDGLQVNSVEAIIDDEPLGCIDGSKLHRML